MKKAWKRLKNAVLRWRPVERNADDAFITLSLRTACKINNLPLFKPSRLQMEHLRERRQAGKKQFIDAVYGIMKFHYATNTCSGAEDLSRAETPTTRIH